MASPGELAGNMGLLYWGAVSTVFCPKAEG